MISLGAFLLIQMLGTALCDPDWAYEEGIDGALGPEEWGKAYEFCKRPNQSPVNIEKSRADKDYRYKDLKYSSTDINFSNMNLTNNGLYLVLKSDDMGKVTMEWKSLYYKLAEIRFHWGQDDSVGSEHTFDGKSYPLAMQLIFYSTNFDSLEDSLEEGYDIYIVAVMFEVASEDNEVMSDVVDALDSIQGVGKTKIIDNIKASLKQLLPAKRNSFFFYDGSLTSPPCAETIWFIYENLQTISSNQLEKFRQLDAKYGGKLTNNVRPIQPLGDRDITYNTY